MIVILSSIAWERSAFGAVCEARGWAYAEADSIRAFKKICRRLHPRVALVRHRLCDGYSDDAIALVRASGQSFPTKILILLAANSPTLVEVRQIELGADCVQRDPVRADIVTAYLARYRESTDRKNEKSAFPRPVTFRFAGGVVDPVNRTLEHISRVVRLTPREIELSQLLAEADGLITYETLYSEILGRKFQGDTSNLRVLLGKLQNSARSTGMELRRSIEVIPKLGYRYLAGENAPAQRKRSVACTTSSKSAVA